MIASMSLLRPILFVFLTLLAVTGCSEKALAPLFDLSTSSPPKIISSNPSEHSGSYNPLLPIYVDFDQAMDAFSTEAAFSLSGSSIPEGSMRWVGNRLIYDLHAPLPPGAPFVLRVNESAKSIQDVALKQDFIVHFVAGSTVEAPTILSHSPAANAQGVSDDSTIVVRFSRPMDPTSVEQSFRITPATHGSIGWNADNTVLTFQPYVHLQSPARYSVHVGTAATDAEGIALHLPFTFAFQTGTDMVRPAVLDIREQGTLTPLSDGYDGVQKESAFVITFSEPMLAFDTERAISLIRRSDGASVPLQKQWSSSMQSLTIQPESNLIPETEYRLTITSAADQQGNLLFQHVHRTFRISNAGGAINSNYLRLLHARIPAPPADQTIPLSGHTTVVTVPGSDLATSGSSGAASQLVLEFSHSLDPGSLPESVSIQKTLGSHPASGRLLGIELQNGSLHATRLLVTIGGLGAGNEYRFVISGRNQGAGRSLYSVSQIGESPTYLEEDIVFNLRVEAGP